MSDCGKIDGLCLMAGASKDQPGGAEAGASG
jgi:hypothetical protein